MIHQLAPPQVPTEHIISIFLQSVRTVDQLTLVFVHLLREPLPKFGPKRHAPARGTIRDERGYTGGESGQVENEALIMNANVSPKLSPGTFLNRQLSLGRRKHVEESHLFGRYLLVAFMTAEKTRITRRNPDGSPVSKLLWN